MWVSNDKGLQIFIDLDDELGVIAGSGEVED
jgi:hypothetical protein